MGSIPLPALGIRPPEQQDPLSGIKSALAIKGAQQQQQLQQQQIQGIGLENQLSQQQVKDQQTVMQVLGAHQGDVNAALPDLAGKVSPQTFISLQKSNLDTRKTLAEIDDKELATKKDQNDRLAQLVSQASSLPPDQYAQQWPSIAQAALGINPKLSDHINPNQPMPQQALQSVGLGLQTQEHYYKQEEDKRAAAKQAAEMPGLLAEAQKKQKENAGTGPTGITAEQLITNKQKQQEIGISGGRLAEEKRHNSMTEAQLTPDALDMAAQQFASTGQMPNVGRGGAVRSQIINAAASKYPKVDLATNSAAFKANESSLKNVTGTLDTLSAFENTGLKNLKQFTDLAQKLPDTGSPFLNTPIRMLNGKMFGDPDQAAALAAGQVALREIARVTNDPKLSGLLTDSARSEVSGLIPQNATLRQIQKVAGVLQQDMANVHGSLESQRDAIKQRLGNSATGGSAPQGGGTPVYAKNPKTGERVMTTDGGKTWAPAQ